jgi:hypothetical protein
MTARARFSTIAFAGMLAFSDVVATFGRLVVQGNQHPSSGFRLRFRGIPPHLPVPARPAIVGSPAKIPASGNRQMVTGHQAG